MKIETNEKHDFFTGTAEDIVNTMNARAFVAEATKAQYMAEVAYRVKILTGTTISNNEARPFLYGLQRAGLVTVIEDRTPKAVDI